MAFSEIISCIQKERKEKSYKEDASTSTKSETKPKNLAQTTQNQILFCKVELGKVFDFFGSERTTIVLISIIPSVKPN